MNINKEKFDMLNSKDKKYLIKMFIQILKDEIEKQDKNDFTKYLLEREEIIL